MQDLLPYSFRSKVFFLPLLVLVICFLCSCGSLKNSYYLKELKRDTTLNAYVDSSMQLKIRQNDVLSVLISSLNKDEDVIYNSSSAAAASSTSGGVGTFSQAPSQYLVDSEGNIKIHHIGYIHAEGLSIKELKLNIEKLLSPYLKDPIVTINFMNHHVTIMGAVQKPINIPMSDQPLTILEAIAEAGDVNLDVAVDNVLIIRDSSGAKQLKHINLEKVSFINSQWYYLHPNDLVYIRPNSQKEDREDRRLKTQQIFTIMATSVSILVLILDRVIK